MIGGQLNMGVNGFDFRCRSRGSGQRIAVLISRTMRRTKYKRQFKPR
jgi:hypothetical protein